MPVHLIIGEILWLQQMSLSSLQNDQRFILQTGDEMILQNHLANKEMILIEKRRILKGEVG